MAGGTACGPERDLSGVWRLTDCGPAGQACADGYVYELHLGRYGDGVTGVVVRYRFQGADLDSFQRQHECGCFFIESGTADEDRLRFELFEPGVARLPDPAFISPDPACRPPPPECVGRRFALDAGAGDTLRGEITCGAGTGPAAEVSFTRTRGKVRTTCVCPGEGDPDRQCATPGAGP